MAGGLVVIVLVAWAWLLAGAGMDMSASAAPWPRGYGGVLFVMWWVMMAAMMLPSAAPTILLAAALNRRAQPERPPYGASGAFALGYLATWGVFSLLAVAAQGALAESGLLSPAMSATSSVAAGSLLVAAGLWQFTPLKRACLRHCRSPIEILTRHHRPGNSGAFVMGAHHGVHCLACCWFLMLLLFVGGVMNLVWIVGLSVYVLGEKLLPRGHQLGRLAGAGLVAWGIAVLAGWL